MKKLLIFLFCGLLGCTSMPTTPKYSFVFTNATKSLLRNVGCKNDQGFHASAGSMAPAASSSDELIPDPIPEEVVVEWQTLDGQNHSKRVAIKKTLPANFTGEIVLTFATDDDVAVSHRPYFEMLK